MATLEQIGQTEGAKSKIGFNIHLIMNKLL